MSKAPNPFLHQQQFLEVLDRDEAERRFRSHLDLTPLERESLDLDHAWNRVLAEDLFAPLDLPGFDRANVDGFAVRADDLFAAREEEPIALRLNPEQIATGQQPQISLQAGTATPIATGAMVPRGANAVVMIEHTEVRGDQVRIARPLAPGANLTFTGTDVATGELILHRGEWLSARETGVLAALGIGRVPVVRQPRVAIISTGNEIVPPGSPLQPGQIYDSNARVLSDSVRELGGLPHYLGVVADDLEALRIVFAQALDADLVLLSGGTSKGAGDISYRVVAEFGPPGIVAHGVALKPGKPLCLAVIARNNQRPLPVAVLPGFPTSAIFTFQEFLAPVIRSLAGLTPESRTSVSGRLPIRVNSERGRTEYLLVGLVPDPSGGLPVAYPMGKGSGSVTAFSKADGFISIPRQKEYLEANSSVEVTLLGSSIQPADLVVIGSHCLGLDYLLSRLRERGFHFKLMTVGSQAGFDAVRRGECDLAGIHLLDERTQSYNRSLLLPGMGFLKGYRRQQGILHRPDDVRFQNHDAITLLKFVVDQKEMILANRNRGSGTRILLDSLLKGAKPEGYLSEFRSHQSVAAAIAQGRADWGVAILPAAESYRLGFVPLREEEYDFIYPESRSTRPGLIAFRELLNGTETRETLKKMGLNHETD
jgi:putative molybdopterin biosynthesis protein